MSESFVGEAKWVKINDRQLYLETVSRRQIEATALAERLEAACRMALAVAGQIQAASAAGVGKASALAVVVNATPFLANDKVASAFFVALAAARDA